MTLERMILIGGMLALAAWAVLPDLLKPFFDPKD